ncbi:tetratricopeptide repeat protein [Robertmurraya massiliosenegalensis]|uniref:hypothetical protein n=1 Tax=Robertmurraya massiliosenegalensis TaxID=1287657 RepID=UPI001375542F|nr:hypothetical protein [Robertmurraya massiliosenegalensis]
MGKKNMADAYVELGLFSEGEKLYTSIVTDSLVLNSEIGLQLFSLYTKLGNMEKADHIIKWVVSINPDYPEVTEIARGFYEKNEDWKSAVDLAVQEGKRQKSIQWFSILNSYVVDGHTKDLQPEYFEDSLLVLKEFNQKYFEQLLSSLWKRYESNGEFLIWVSSVNQLFNKMEAEEPEEWHESKQLFREVFFSLINGKYLIKDIENLVPDVFKNWLRVADSAVLPLIYGGILAWNDYFPRSLNREMLEKAEAFISREPVSTHSLEESIELLFDIIKWGEEESIAMSELLQWNGKTLHFEREEDVNTFLLDFDEVERYEILLQFVRKLLDKLLEKKEEQKQELQNNINWHKEILSKLNGAVHQLDDLKFGKSKVIKKSFVMNKEDIKETVQSKLPEILKSCSDLVTEESDFKKLHIDINDVMNERVQQFLYETVQPLFKKKFQSWVKKSELEFIESKKFLEEMTDGLNQLVGSELLNMECDFQVLNDWKRDMERMTNFVAYERENFFLRFTPSQFLLKSAGKLLGGLSQNKGFLANQYKKHIENEDFREVTKMIVNRFLQQLEIFERSLDRDIAMFFENPVHVLQSTVEHMTSEKEQYEQELQSLKSNPEKFYDPMILFQIRHRQFDWLNIGSYVKNE